VEGSEGWTGEAHGCEAGTESRGPYATEEETNGSKDSEAEAHGCEAGAESWVCRDGEADRRRSRR